MSRIRPEARSSMVGSLQAERGEGYILCSFLGFSCFSIRVVASFLCFFPSEIFSAFEELLFFPAKDVRTSVARSHSGQKMLFRVDRYFSVCSHSSFSVPLVTFKSVSSYQPISIIHQRVGFLLFFLHGSSHLS